MPDTIGIHKRKGLKHDILSHQSSVVSGGEIKRDKESIAKIFKSCKKLPAMTSKKYGETHRLSFSRRITYEEHPLFIIAFN